MLNFRKPTIKDKAWITECIRNGETDGCCYSFGNLFAWCDAYSLEVAEYEGMCLMRGIDSQGRYYVYPSGVGDIKKAIELLIEDAAGEGCVFRFEQLLENNKNTVEELFPDMFSFKYDRDSSEYVYSIENMANLPGKKFHGKKGHVNAFFRKHTDVHCDPITEDNIPLCLEIAQSWLSEKDDENGELQREFDALKKSLSNFEKLGFTGAILFADDKAVAFAMGEELKNNTFCTHYEKTLPDYRDAFPVINNGFTKLMLLSYTYVNREEDTGAEGLRKAKLSYYPEFLLDKYSAVFKNDPKRKYYADENDYPELLNLWKTVFGDSDEIIDCFLKTTVEPQNIYAYRKDGKIVSVFYLIDASIKNNSDNFSAKYLYAAATLPEYRKQGIMTEMINNTAEELKKQGTDFLFLYPADDKLYDYYSKMGFTTAFHERFYIIEKKEIESYSGERYFNCALQYDVMRQSIPSEGFAEFDVRYLDFARFCAKKGGFEINCLFDDEDSVFIIGNAADSTAIIEEAISLNGNYSHILSVLADTEFERFVLKTPVCIKLGELESEIKKSGMLLPICKQMPENKNIYLGQPCM